MTPRASIFITIFISFWLAGILFYSLKEARDQASIIKSAGMVLIQGGCYEMGDPFGNGVEDEHPVHIVCVDPFYLGKEMVTVGEFKKFVTETGYLTDAEKSEGCGNKNWRYPGFLQTDWSPVVCVSWNDALEYIRWMRKKSPKKGISYRLPTEGEWEFAARNRGEKIQERFNPRESTLFHRTENVREWIQDWYGENFYNEGHKTNPAGPSAGKYRVLRGGSSINEAGGNGVFARHKMEPQFASREVGFRLALPMTDR